MGNGLFPDEEEESCIHAAGLAMESPQRGEYGTGQDGEDDGGGVSFAWFLVPVLGAGLLLAFMGLSKTKV